MRLALALTLVALSTGCPEPQPTPGPPPPKPTAGSLNGLKLSAPQIKRTPTALEIECRFEWTADVAVAVDAGTLEASASNLWSLDLQEPMTLSFIDAAGRNIGEVVQAIELSQAFVDRRQHHTNSTLSVALPPQGARAVQLSLGKSGLKTSKLSLPPEIQ